MKRRTVALVLAFAVLLAIVLFLIIGTIVGIKIGQAYSLDHPKEPKTFSINIDPASVYAVKLDYNYQKFSVRRENDADTILSVVKLINGEYAECDTYKAVGTLSETRIDFFDADGNLITGFSMFDNYESMLCIGILCEGAKAPFLDHKLYINVEYGRNLEELITAITESESCS